MASRTPLSIESLLAKQCEEKEANSKPKFLSKQERAAIALAKRAAEVEAAKDKELATQKARDELEQKARAEGGQYNQQGYGGGSAQGQNGYGRDGGLNYGGGGRGGRGDYGGYGRGGRGYSGPPRGGGGRGGGGLGYNNDRRGPAGDAPSNAPSGPRGGGGRGRGGYEGRGGYDQGRGGHDQGRRDDRYAGGRRDDRRDDRYDGGRRDDRDRRDDRSPPREQRAANSEPRPEVDGAKGAPVANGDAMEVDQATPNGGVPLSAASISDSSLVMPSPAPTDSVPPPHGAPPPPPTGDAPPPPPSAPSADAPTLTSALVAPPSDAPPPPPSTMPPPPPPTRKERTPTSPPAPKLTLAEMAALRATNAAPAPLNAQLHATRYLGARAPDKRKIRKTSDKKFVFDWDRTDDTGADEVDPIYAPYIPRPAASSKHDSRHGGGASREPHTYGVKLDDRQKQVAAPSMQGTAPGQIGMYGRGMLAGFDREAVPGRKGEKKAKGAIDERHWSDKTLAEMKDRDWRIFREDFSIAARGGSIPLPLRSWKESNIPQQLLDVINEVGFDEPSPIQRQAIPIGLMNRDQIGIAETGSGKTAAFVIPMLAYISRLPPLSDENRGRGPYALVLAPTRELAQQIESETNKFTKLLGYKCVSIVGGRAIEEQQFNMRFGAEIVIATPGRLKDCIERHVLVLGQCTYVVMDEADRMVSLGFEDVINFILDALPVSNLKPDTDDAEDGEKMSMVINAAEGDESGNTTLALYRQTVMFSATMPAAVERLAKKYLRRPAIVTIGVAGQAVDTVDQRVEFITTEDKKKARLIEILNTGAFEPPMIVFVNQKKGADVLMKDLQRAHWSATSLHSGKNQEQREAALNSIRNKECDVLVATDLAGRGIDVPDVSLVVNFQMANNIEAYIHRIGRTGRAGKTGVAVTFLSEADEELMYDLKTEISKSPVSKCPPELMRHPAAQTKQSSAFKRSRADVED